MCYFFLLIGNTSTGQLILNEEEETTVDINSPETGDKTQKGDISLTMVNSNDTFLSGNIISGFQILCL